MENRKKVIPAGAPFIAAGIIWFVLAVIGPIYRIGWFIAVAILSVIVCVIMSGKRKKQIEALPKEEPIKVRAQEIAKKMDEGRDKIRSLESEIKDNSVRETVESMAHSMDMLADDVEKDPKDRNKIRKIAIHYVPMITDLVEKYINLEKQGTAGENISSAMVSIKEGLGNVDESLKQYLDSVFDDDKIDIETDIAILTQLLNKKGAEDNKLNFDDILKDETGGSKNE